MATRFWVGGTGTWDSSTTTHWAATSGGAGGQSVPGSSDTVTFDASSGGGTVTLNFGGTITIQSIALGAFTGTFDNSVNNNNITLSQTAGFNGSGSGARSIKLGSATYTLLANQATWTIATTTNLTFAGSSANIVFSGSSAVRTFAGGGLSYGAVTLGASSGSGSYSITGSNAFALLSIAAPNYVQFTVATTNTISAAFNWAGSSSSQIGIMTTGTGVAATIAAAAGSAASWATFRDMTFTGSPLASDSFDLGNNSGITISPPNPPIARAITIQRGTPY